MQDNVITAKSKYACRYSKHAPNYTTHAYIGAFTNRTTYADIANMHQIILHMHILVLLQIEPHNILQPVKSKNKLLIIWDFQTQKFSTI